MLKKGINSRSRFGLFIGDLGNLAIDVVKLMDPTGITSWGDAYKAIKSIDKKNPGSISNAVVEPVGALPVVGKIGKIGKLSKLVRNTEKFIVKAGKVVRIPEKTTKTAIALAKVPGKVATIPVKFIPKGRNKINSLRNTVRMTHVASSADDAVLGGAWKKNIAFNIAKKSAGEASPIALMGIMLPSSYNGTTKANDVELEPASKEDVIRQMLFGESQFKPYEKPIYINGERLNNTYYGQLYPANKIVANRKLKNTMQQANSENFFYTKNEMPIIDSHKFRIKFNKDFARASDTFDFNTNELTGRMMMAAMKPTWWAPNSGAPTFVQEIPVTYADDSDETLKIALKK